MHRPLTLGAALVLAISAQAETLTVTDLDVDSIRVLGSVEVEVSQGDSAQLQIRGDADDLDQKTYPLFYVKDSTLVLGATKSGGSSRFSDLQYRVTLPDLEALRLNGSG